jgi:hypothetical protein
MGDKERGLGHRTAFGKRRKHPDQTLHPPAKPSFEFFALIKLRFIPVNRGGVVVQIVQMPCCSSMLVIPETPMQCPVQYNPSNVILQPSLSL